MQVLLIRGIITIILAIATILIAIVAIYYYFRNEKVTKTNINNNNNNIFGPTLLLFVILIATIINLILSAFLFYSYGASSITLGNISNKLKEKCIDYEEFGTKVKNVIKKKLYEYKYI